MTKGSENLFPRVLLNVGADDSASPADTLALFLDGTDLSTVDESGSVVAIGGGTPDAHAASHESGGSDEIDVTGLTGAGGGGGGGRHGAGAIVTGFGANNTAALVAHLAPDGAVPSLVQATGPAGYSGGSGPTLGTAPIVGNILLAFYFSNQYALNDGSGISQTNVTWTRVAQAKLEAGAYVVVELWQGVVGASPGSAITISPTSNNSQGVYVQEWTDTTGVDAADTCTSYDANHWTAVHDAMPLNMSSPTLGGMAVVYARLTGGTAATPVGWSAFSGFPASGHAAAYLDMS